MYRIFPLLFLFLIVGCATVPEKAFRSTIRVASLDISSVSGRLEKKSVEDLGRLLTKEEVEIVAVQGITRYPGVRTRVDFVEALANEIDMQHVFGEVMNLSGRQTGNAVLSIYPILASKNQPIDLPPSPEFAASLHAVVDRGIVKINVVSARLPGKGRADDHSKRVKAIAAANGRGAPIILTGNLPASDAVSAAGGFQRTNSIVEGEIMWYGKGGPLKPLNGRLVKTAFGTMTVVEFGLDAGR